MTEIVGEVIALCFEDVVIFVFCLPTTASGISHFNYSLVIERMIGHPAIAIELLSVVLTGDGELAPVD